MATYKPRVDILERNDEYYPLLEKRSGASDTAFGEDSPCNTLDAAITKIERDLRHTFIPGEDEIAVAGVNYTDLNEGVAAFRAACKIANVPPTYY